MAVSTEHHPVELSYRRSFFIYSSTSDRRAIKWSRERERVAEYTTRGQVINRYKKVTEACELQVRLLTSKKERSKPKRTFFFNEPSLSTMRMTTVTQDLTTTMDLSTDDPSIIDRLESFLYTPMGVGTLAAVAVVITSLVWLVGCCIYCCCRRRRSSEEGGVTVAKRDLMFLDIGLTEPVHNSTMSSGYKGSA